MTDLRHWIGINKRLLQVMTAGVGAIAVVTGVLGLFGLSASIYADQGFPAYALLDSNLRFLCGVWSGMGLAILWLVPRIETETVLFRVLWGMIFLGGLGRLLSMIFHGWPPAPFIVFTGLEILGAPVFIAWQARLACAYSGIAKPR
jgi:hypothetical protein